MKAKTLFSKQEYLRKINTSHDQSLRFYGQRHRKSERSGNEIEFLKFHKLRGKEDVLLVCKMSNVDEKGLKEELNVINLLHVIFSGI